ncbi:type II toxin-antitoxin system RelE/ParE family toxin [Pseudomonas saxonica]
MVNAFRESERAVKELFWIGSSKKDLMDMPLDVQQVFGYALHLAQEGGKHSQAKPMKGLTSSGVLEVVEDFEGDTYRAVYTVKIGDAIYALHTFKKKSNKGIETPKHEIDLIKVRLKAAEDHAKGQKK